MKLNVRRFLIFLGLLVVFTTIKFPYDSFSPTVKERIRAEAQRAGVFWDSRDFKFNMPPQIDAEQVSGVIKTPAAPLPLPFLIDSLHGTVSLWSLLTLSPHLEATASLYGGNCQVSLLPLMAGGFRSVDLQCDSLRLEKYPALEFYKVRGSLSGDATSQSGNKATVSIRLRNGSIEEPKRISMLAPEQIADVSLDATAEVEERRATIKSFSLTSSLGTASGKGLLVTNERGFLSNESSLAVEISLSETGEAAISPYLALAANLPVDRKSSAWQIQLKGTGGQIPNVKVTPRS